MILQPFRLVPFLREISGQEAISTQLYCIAGLSGESKAFFTPELYPLYDMSRMQGGGQAEGAGIRTEPGQGRELHGPVHDSWPLRGAPGSDMSH